MSVSHIVKCCATRIVQRYPFNNVIRNMHCTPQKYTIRTQVTYSRGRVETPRKETEFSSPLATVAKDEREEFDSIFPSIVKDLTDSVKHLNVPELITWYTRMLEYNVPVGKKRRGFSTVLAYKLLEDPQKLTPENIRLAGIMGWCMELLTASILIIDDIVDRSEMRFGVPCWYKLEDVGLTAAVTDAIVLENCTYAVLRKYFNDHFSYVSMLELLHDMSLKTYIGQTLEPQISGMAKSTWTMDRYRTIVLYKTSYFAFYFPVAAAMYLAGIHDAQLHAEAGSVLRELGHWFQAKNDFLDCYGDLSANGANLYGDIREGKCTWPAVMALERASSAQRAVMERCYGRPDDESVQAVMDVYKALDVSAMFAVYEEETRTNIRNEIERMNPKLVKKVFYNVMDMI